MPAVLLGEAQPVFYVRVFEKVLEASPEALEGSRVSRDSNFVGPPHNKAGL
jgi:hypothetical protein